LSGETTQFRAAVALRCAISQGTASRQAGIEAESKSGSKFGGWMLTGIKRMLGWIFGPLFALLIVIAVHFFERRIRLDIRRDPAWRSH
jgi:hypothetical protein